MLSTWTNHKIAFSDCENGDFDNKKRFFDTNRSYLQFMCKKKPRQPPGLFSLGSQIVFPAGFCSAGNYFASRVWQLDIFCLFAIPGAHVIPPESGCVLRLFFWQFAAISTPGIIIRARARLGPKSHELPVLRQMPSQSTQPPFGSTTGKCYPAPPFLQKFHPNCNYRHSAA